MKTRIEEIRRGDLVRAAFLVFREHGMNGMTVARIGERVGMSHGIVNYYFKNKDDLLHAVMRYAFRLISDETVRLLKLAHTPRERIGALIQAVFQEDTFEPNTAAAWLSFYGHAHQNPQFARLQNLYYARLHSNLKHGLKQLAAEEQAEKIAKGVAVLIDGFWVRRTFEGTGSSPTEAVAFVNAYVDDELPARPARRVRRAPR